MGNFTNEVGWYLTVKYDEEYAISKYVLQNFYIFTHLSSSSKKVSSTEPPMVVFTMAGHQATSSLAQTQSPTEKIVTWHSTHFL